MLFCPCFSFTQNLKSNLHSRSHICSYLHPLVRHMLKSLSHFNCQDLIIPMQKGISPPPFLEAIKLGVEHLRRGNTFQAQCMLPTWGKGSRGAHAEQVRSRWGSTHSSTKTPRDTQRAVKGRKKEGDAQWWSKKREKQRGGKEGAEGNVAVA